MVFSVSLTIWNEPLPAPLVALQVAPEVASEMLGVVYVKDGVAGVIETLNVPIALPDAKPVVVHTSVAQGMDGSLLATAIEDMV